MEASITTGEHVYRAMRDMIISGELPSGSRLVQRQLAARFQTSNIPVVEAIRRLEHDGLVVSHSNRGARVGTWTLRDISAMYKLRESVEAFACRVFAEEACGDQRRRLAKLGEEFDVFAASTDRRRCIEVDQALHQFVVECSGSYFLLQQARSLDLISLALEAGLRIPLTPDQEIGPVGVHDAMIRALTSGYADVAEHAAREHVSMSLHRLLERAHAAGIGAAS